jgi:hypothetical protein
MTMPTQPAQNLDLSNVENCRDVVLALQKAYLSLVAGNTRLRVRFADRWTEYTPGKAKELLDLIGTIRTGCPEAVDTLQMNRAYRAQRGRPARFFPV